MKIGELSRTCGCPPETIRYYEKIGLLPTSARAVNGYRIYNDSHVNVLRFILRSRDLGFSQRDVRRLVDMAGLEQPPCSEVHKLLERQLADVRDRIDQMRRMERALQRLKTKCKNGTLPACPVIDELLI